MATYPPDYDSETDLWRYCCPYDHRAVSMGGDWACRTCDEQPMYVVDRTNNEVVWTNPSQVDPTDFHVPTPEDMRAMVEQSRLTQAEIAEQIGVSQKAVSKWIRGANDPETRHLRAFCDVMRDHFDNGVRGDP